MNNLEINYIPFSKILPSKPRNTRKKDILKLSLKSLFMKNLLIGLILFIFLIVNKSISLYLNCVF